MIFWNVHEHPFSIRSSLKRERSYHRNQLKKGRTAEGEKIFDTDGPRSGYIQMEGNPGRAIAHPRKNLYFDESAEPSMSKAYDTFVIGGLAVDDDSEMERIVRSFPPVDWEYKYNRAKMDDPDGCASVMTQIRDSKADIYAKVVKKDRDVDKRRPYQVYAQTLRDLVDDILARDETAQFILYLDRQSYLTYDDLCRLFEGYDRVKVLDPELVEGVPGLRVADFVASSVQDYFGNSVERRPKHYEKIKGRIANKNARRRSVWLINASHGLAFNGQEIIAQRII